ncbi:MAG: hypothetical protein Q7J85_11085 [Bacillota bacterium]|nr:hypothetical protein [Bacillota bacterium]
MLSPKMLKKSFAKVEKDNWMLRSFLKGQDEDEVDRIVNGLHRELFAGYDCVACSNCCKVIAAKVEDDEIGAIAKKLGLTDEEFKDK